MEIISDRAASVLRAVVERYMALAEPVGAKTLAHGRKFSLSAASIRNVMQELELKGYLTAPHTSAGRIPTDKGYRYFVNSLMQPVMLSLTEIENLKNATHGSRWRDFASLLSSVSRALAELSMQTALVGFVSSNGPPVKKIHFVKIQEELVMAVIVGPGGEIRNRLIRPSGGFTQSHLDRISNYFNDRFAGMTLPGIYSMLLEETLLEKNRVDFLVKWAFQMADAMEKEERAQADEMVCVEGVSNLLIKEKGGPKISEVKTLLKTLDEKSRLTGFLNELLVNDGVNLVIGGESGIEELSQFSMVSHVFPACNKPLGAVCIIGPKIMDYGKIVALVSVTALEMGQRLSGCRYGEMH